ncbi:hypothetical protein GQX74_008883 [Glossina fuscipes]|nr:hypothetical protein GQX74_008883 [Glossina fuscipes]
MEEIIFIDSECAVRGDEQQVHQLRNNFVMVSKRANISFTEILHSVGSSNMVSIRPTEPLLATLERRALDTFKTPLLHKLFCNCDDTAIVVIVVAVVVAVVVAAGDDLFVLWVILLTICCIELNGSLPVIKSIALCSSIESLSNLSDHSCVALSFYFTKNTAKFIRHGIVMCGTLPHLISSKLQPY